MEIIEIKEDVRIRQGDHNILLEAGDVIQVLKESGKWESSNAKEVLDIITKYRTKVTTVQFNSTNAFIDGELGPKVKLENDGGSISVSLGGRDSYILFNPDKANQISKYIEKSGPMTRDARATSKNYNMELRALALMNQKDTVVINFEGVYVDSEGNFVK